MESDEEIKELIKSKYQQGVSRKKLKEIVAEEGFKPEEVDEALNGLQKSPGQEDDKQINTQTNKEHDRKIENNNEGDGLTDSASHGTGISVEESGKQVEQIASKNQEKTHQKRKLLLPAGILFLTIIIGLALLPVTGMINLDNSTNKSESYIAENEENTNFSQNKDSNTVILENGLADPARASASSDEEIVFVNRQNESLELEFDTGKDMSIESGQRKAESFSTITYYTAEGKSTEIKGSIYIE
jgi:DNA-binding transcriptional MerR regulator